ncbi:hypothetical protein TEA_010595 [Camellia sinensis var. sinensis]|uniref:Uncharacterized protein n=1 Tax=Camellia sinensis var. sinensis TaxID=542762 RepID=A0A4S4D6G2_CAMSN|nr:hypothetical protein TEA_010595 [Camellia sinensis var. sinensis]
MKLPKYPFLLQTTKSLTLIVTLTNSHHHPPWPLPLFSSITTVTSSSTTATPFHLRTHCLSASVPHPVRHRGIASVRKSTIEPMNLVRLSTFEQNTLVRPSTSETPFRLRVVVAFLFATEMRERKRGVAIRRRQTFFEGDEDGQFADNDPNSMFADAPNDCDDEDDGFPDDGYNYLIHLREIKNTGGGSAYYHNSKAKLDQLPLDVKAYDALRVEILGVNDDSNKKSIYNVASRTVGVRIQKAVDPEVVALLDDSDLSRFGSNDEDLEEDFVVKANLLNEAEDVEFDKKLNLVENSAVNRKGVDVVDFVDAEMDNKQIEAAIMGAAASIIAVGIVARPEHQQYLNKKIEFYDETAVVIGRDMATGNFAKSFVNIDAEAKIVESIDFGIDVEDVAKRKYVTSSSEISSEARSHKRNHCDQDDSYDKLSEQIGEVASAIKKLTEDQVNGNDLYEEVMKMQGYDEFMLAQHLIIWLKMKM